ncbi:alpha-L-fucosidase [Tamlana sp. 2201CG12-4]|uniref:alpha-L-fucosidase n=1 Tax=Tamlana sp. 2201CG12-4 TaxID=3112582 RepID=UPI002DBB7303|nr:alpha-L-fucosidase [Tamlana sp. 2201CG12-4]MEC3907218.1 alpha-L-fucosidase [Tamlana sp. 2201CG12-4]
MKKILLLIFLVHITACVSGKKIEKETKKYDENWDSLAKHKESPDWFSDSKLGIYFHWGVYSVPAFGGEWYPRNMYIPGHGFNKHHLETYGDLQEFGYHDFVPMFKAEKFDAKAWVDLFEKAGARFAGPVAEHHDGFSMWDSEVTPWNSMAKGPKKDILGELKRELDKKNMKLIATFHHSKQLQRYNGKEESAKEHHFKDSHYPMYPGLEPERSKELDYLYGNIPEDKWLEDIWFGKLKEVIDKYNPDIMWFDSWLDRIPEDYRAKFCAYYLNEAEKWNKEVVIVRKQDDLPLDFSVDDLEKSRKNKMGDKVWMTDETISKGSWCYTENLTIKPTKDVLHVLIDIVSKNGVLLLNVSPKADGSIPLNQQQVLLGMGDWLKKYGEAIYGTRPWFTYGEGPTKEPDGHFKNAKKFLKVKYSDKDVRYTTKERTIYATILGKPDSEKLITLEAFKKENASRIGKIDKVEVLGSTGEITWRLTEGGLQLKMPKLVPDEMAIVVKIVTKPL